MTDVTTVPDSVETALSRRKMFSMCSVGLLGAATLAACGSDDSAADPTASAASTAGADGATATADAGAAVTSLVALSEVPVAGAVSLEVAGKPVIVSQPEKGEVIAFSALCPHQFATVTISGKELRCPLHGSTFDMATGKNLTGPAAGKPLPAYPVKVVDGGVVPA